MPADPADWLDQVLDGGRYHVRSAVGAGGMALVHRAGDRKLDAEVVIKVPRPAVLQNPDFAGRLTQEIRSLVELSHPHIVNILDVGLHGGLPYAVMECLPGGSLRDRIGREVRTDLAWLTNLSNHRPGRRQGVAAASGQARLSGTDLHV